MPSTTSSNPVSSGYWLCAYWDANIFLQGAFPIFGSNFINHVLVPACTVLFAHGQLQRLSMSARDENGFEALPGGLVGLIRLAADLQCLTLTINDCAGLSQLPKLFLIC